jgi:hypothetical protein
MFYFKLVFFNMYLIFEAAEMLPRIGAARFLNLITTINLIFSPDILKVDPASGRAGTATILVTEDEEYGATTYLNKYGKKPSCYE